MQGGIGLPTPRKNRPSLRKRRTIGLGGIFASRSLSAIVTDTQFYRLNETSFGNQHRQKITKVIRR